MPKIFVSYRRKDSAPFVGRIYERLVREFGESNIFYDIEDIPKGKNFKDVLRQSVASCDVLLAMIGPQWASITDANGNKRLFDDNDYVRYEVDTALRLPKVTVIPVLINDAEMPSKTDLPSVLHDLTELNAIKVRNDPDFRRDMDDLVKVIGPRRSRTPIGIALVTVLIVAIIALVVFAPRLFPSLTAVSTTTQVPTTIVPSPTDQPTSTLTPTYEPSLTPPLPSETPSPTDAPTPIPPSPLPPVSISVPTVVLPNTTILVTAWQNAHCIFTPDDGNIPFGFDTSTGNIQYTVKHKAGTIVSIVCEDAQSRHAENQFTVSAAAIPTATVTFTSTPVPPTPASTSGLIVGELAVIAPNPDGYLNLRSAIGRDKPVLAQVPVASIVLMLDGPVYAEDMLWWKLRAPNGVIGWTVEAGGNRQLLMPFVATAIPTLAPTITSLMKHYPCAAQIIFNANIPLNVIHVRPVGSSSLAHSVQQGAKVIITATEQESTNVFWYHITDVNSTEIGWIQTLYVVPSDSCPQ